LFSGVMVAGWMGMVVPVIMLTTSTTKNYEFYRVSGKYTSS